MYVARTSPNFLSHIKAYFIALSKNWDPLVILGYYAEYVGSCLPTFRIAYGSQLQVSRGPRRMQGNQANNQATNKRSNRPTDRPTDRQTDRPTDQPTNQPTKELSEGGDLRFAQVDVPRPIYLFPFYRIVGLSNRHLKLQLGMRFLL